MFADTTNAPPILMQSYILMWKSTKKILKIGKMKQPCYRIVMHQIIIRTVVIYTMVMRPMVINTHGGRPKNAPPQPKPPSRTPGIPGHTMWITIVDNPVDSPDPCARTTRVIHIDRNAVHRKRQVYPHHHGISLHSYTVGYTGYPQFMERGVTPLSTADTQT